MATERKTLVAGMGIVAIVLAVGVAVSPANAGLVPVSAYTGSNNKDNYGGNMSDLLSGEEMTKTDPDDPSTWTTNVDHYSHEWQTAGLLSGATNGKIAWTALDFGSTVANLESAYFWNIREATAQNRRTVNYNIYYADSPTVALPAAPTDNSSVDYDFASGGWTSLSATPLSMPQRGATPDPADQVVALGGISARYLGVEILSNAGGTRAGLSEVAVTAGAAGPPPSPGVKILMVTNNNGTTQSLVDFLEANGHTVTRGTYGGGIPSQAELDAHDLIIVARESDSGAYDDGSEPQDWNGIELPLINMNMYLYRSSRWGWMNGTSLPGLGNLTDFDAYLQPDHPFVDGLTTELFGSPTGVTGAGNPLPTTAEIIAMLNSGQSPGIFILPEGTVMFNGRGVAGGVRVGFIRGNEGSWSAVSPNGQQILLNMINDLTQPDLIPEPATLSLLGLGGLLALRRQRRR